jgi:hypothetical protein
MLRIQLFTETDADLAFYFNADPDPNFPFNANPNLDPAPHQSDANLRPQVYKRSRTTFLASKGPELLNIIRIRIKLFTLIWILNQLSKFMRIGSRNHAKIHLSQKLFF